VLANVPPDHRHLVASGIVGAFKGIWRDSWGPRLEYILYNAISALLDCRNATLLGVNRMLTDEKYRAKVIRQIKDPFIRAFWAEEYEGYDERFKREAIAPIQNRIGQCAIADSPQPANPAREQYSQRLAASAASGTGHAAPCPLSTATTTADNRSGKKDGC